MTSISNSPIIITCFDFDGTLRDGLEEKVWAFQTAIEITGRIMGFHTDKPYLADDMRALAGVATGKIAVKHWPDVYGGKGKASKKAFKAVYEQVWKDIYRYFHKETRDPNAAPSVTKFTPEEEQKILRGMPIAAWFEGTQNLLKDLHDKGFYTGVLSNTPDVESLVNEVTSGGVAPYVNSIFTGSPIEMGKPHPYALFHFITSAWSEQYDKDQHVALNEAYARKDADAYKAITDALLDSIKTSDRDISILMIGDGVPDIRVGNSARWLLSRRGLGKRVKVETLALTYGFMTEAQLAPYHPTHWAQSPSTMATVVNNWAENPPRPSFGASQYRAALRQDQRSGLRS